MCCHAGTFLVCLSAICRLVFSLLLLTLGFSLHLWCTPVHLGLGSFLCLLLRLCHSSGTSGSVTLQPCFLKHFPPQAPCNLMSGCNSVSSLKITLSCFILFSLLSSQSCLSLCLLSGQVLTHPFSSYHAPAN